ncbi:Tetratricopeptide repeat-containing protein [Roseovarius marisflavi]|uniref:Tetratricopeptide repeat-containing protein n=1 Tax=Roseovarius marisflavi TaxID=1054996 RepID=A0A1M7CGE4_9RHOB|nr:tetratricopeptide repeat protein [Roseovarius marisflavi]SHL66244.1 Tetratricopeptide repeat-containing protein [Roseovarius marisflavi]
MIKLTFLALATAGTLSFCDNAEQRADKHFQSGLELLEKGDVDRALVEFRNVFQLNGQHREARLQYADAVRARGNIGEAYGQYLRLVEQYPDSLAGQRALAELALRENNWEEARRHGRAAAELDPDDRLVQAVNATVSYRDAVVAKDATAERAAVTKAQALVAEDPDLMIARQVIITDLMRAQNWTAALSAIDAALAESPDDQELYTIRLGVLNQLGETREIRAQLEEMITRFPEDPSIPATLVRWYISQGDVDAAEAFLKTRADQEPRDPDDIITYIRFLSEVRSLETAKVELDRIIASDPPERERLIALRAGFRFDLGERDAAIAEMEELIDAMEPSDERRSIMVMLARMLEVTDNQVGARALVEQVLEEDKNQVDAMKLRAGWLIESDRVDEAIVTLRAALGQAPNDAGAMSLMAHAHERAGNRDLMADMLSRAVDASRNAPEESLRYASHLISQGDLRTAETVLINALRLSPNHIAMLRGLGDIYVRDRDWPRLTQVIETLRREDGANAQRVANDLTARQLAAQDREDELMGFLDTLAGEGASGMGAAALIVRTHLAQGNLDAALQYAREILDANPGDPEARFLVASVQVAGGDIEAAETTFRDLATENPQDQRFWLALYNIHALQEDVATARQALLDGLEANPDNLRLNWALAGVLEREGDIQGAIDIYERLYAADSNNLIIANNLASLLATGSEDADSLTRAHEIARRLRDRDVPAFQDTYGWIAFRRGDLDTALAALEPAAASLPADPTVQYHLARTYVALKRDADALAQFRKVVEAAENGPELAFMDEVKGEIDRLSASVE